VNKAQPASAIAETMNLPTLEAVRVISDSQRHRIYSQLITAEMTAGDLSAALGLSRTRLYYHLKLLLDHGLIRIVSERPVNGIAEKMYRACARNLRVDRNVLSANASETEIADAQAAIVDQIALDLRARARRAPATNEDVLVTRTFLRLSARRHAAMRKKLLAVLAEYERTPDDDGDDVELAMALFTTGETRA
jgi:DNA-binding transcriptional ArsR family regulator